MPSPRSATTPASAPVLVRSDQGDVRIHQRAPGAVPHALHHDRRVERRQRHARIKQKFSDKEGVPVEFIVMWLDEPIGRCARVRRASIPRPFPRLFFLGRNRCVGSPRSRPTRARRIYMGKVPSRPASPRPNEEELNIFGPDTRLDKFPHWRCLCATIAEEEDALEEVQ